MNNSELSKLTYDQLIELKSDLEIELGERQSEYEAAELREENAMFDSSISYDDFLGYASISSNRGASLVGCYELLEEVKKQINKLKNQKK